MSRIIGRNRYAGETYPNPTRGNGAPGPQGPQGSTASVTEGAVRAALAVATAEIAINDQSLTGAKNIAVNGEIDDGNSGASKTIDWNLGGTHKLTLTANCTLTFTDPSVSPCWLQLTLLQDAIGSRTVTFPVMKWRSGAPPTLTTTPTTGEDIISIYFNGSEYRGMAALNFA